MIPKDINVRKYNSLKAYKDLFNKNNNNLLIFIIICSLLQASHAMYYGYSTIIWANKGLSFFKIGILWSFAIIVEVFLFIKIDKYFKFSFLSKSLMFCFCWVGGRQQATLQDTNDTSDHVSGMLCLAERCPSTYLRMCCA